MNDPFSPDTPEVKPPWWRSKTTLLSLGAVVCGLVKETLGVDLGQDNVANVAVGTAAIGGGVVLVLKGARPICAIVAAWWKARSAK